MTTSGEKMRREMLNNDNHIIMNFEISFYIVLSLKYLFMQYFSLTFCKEKYLRLLFYNTDIFLPQSIQIDRIDVSIYGRLCTWSQTAEYGTSENRTTAPPTEYRLKSFARAEKI